MATAVRLLLLLAVVYAGAAGFASGDPNSEVRDLLQNAGLPKGLLPDSVVDYSLADGGDFTVELSAPCYVHFSKLVYYNKTIRGKIAYGAISGLSGIQAKKAFLWVTVDAIEAHDDGTIEFKVGFLSESLPESEFDAVPVCSKKAASRGGFFPEELLPAAVSQV